MQWKTSKSIHLLSNQFWNPIANVSVKVQNEKTSIKNLKDKRKKLIPISQLTNYTRQYDEMKEKLKPVSFIYVGTIFEHQVKDIYASQKLQVLSNVRSPWTNIRHDQGHQREGASTGSINIIQKKNITVYELESQKKVNAKLWKRTNWFSEVIKEIIHQKFRSS